MRLMAQRLMAQRKELVFDSAKAAVLVYVDGAALLWDGTVFLFLVAFCVGMRACCVVNVPTVRRAE